MKDCNACGKCCIKYSNGGLSATSQEIAQWQDEAPQIADYVQNGEIWFDPDTKESLTICPFLQKIENSKTYTCSIYFNRPDDCRFYPSTLDEMMRDECEMIEERDLKNPKNAQQALEIIMKDSWI